MKKLSLLVPALLLALVSAGANAALPTGLDTFFTEIQADFTTLMGYAVPVMIVILSGFIGLRLFRKAAHTTIK